MRIICGDPGRSADSFGMFGGILDVKRRMIYPKYAREWIGMSFARVANEFKKDWKAIKPHFFAIESNNEGREKAHPEFERRGMKTQLIATSGMLTERNRFRWQTMDKPYTVQWLREFKAAGQIGWPKSPGRTMKKFENQMLSIEEYTTPTGMVGYRARRNGHDDIFLASLLFFHVCRIVLEREYG